MLVELVIQERLLVALMAAEVVIVIMVVVAVPIFVSDKIAYMLV